MKDSNRLPISFNLPNCSETFKQLLDETQRAEAPRDHVVLDIDPVFNQAAIIKGKYKLIVGKAAFMEFDQVYPLIDVSIIFVFWEPTTNLIRFSSLPQGAYFLGYRKSFVGAPNRFSQMVSVTSHH